MKTSLINKEMMINLNSMIKETNNQIIQSIKILMNLGK